MKAIVLAAGVGRRISDKIDALPKSLLKVAGEPVIARTARLLRDIGADIAVCTGYRHALVESALGDIPANVFYNPFYAISNNIASLWFAREVFRSGDDVLVLSADLVFDPAVLRRVASMSSDLVMAVDSSRTRDGDYFFTLGPDGAILEYGPDIPLMRRSCEYMGVSRVSSSVGPRFADRLDEMVEKGDLHSYFETVFFSFREDPAVRLRTVDVAGLPWREIDRYEDYEKAIERFGGRKT